VNRHKQAFYERIAISSFFTLTYPPEDKPLAYYSTFSNCFSLFCPYESEWTCLPVAPADGTGVAKNGKLCVADIIYCIFKNADADGGSWIDFCLVALCFFFIARPVRMVGKMIVGFRVRHKAKNPT